MLCSLALHVQRWFRPSHRSLGDGAPELFRQAVGPTYSISAANSSIQKFGT